MSSWRHEQRVRERAHEIWRNAGFPEGESDSHWRQAETEIAAEERGLEHKTGLEIESVSKSGAIGPPLGV